MEFGSSTSSFSLIIEFFYPISSDDQGKERRNICIRKNETKIKSKEDINCGLNIDGFILCFYHRCRLRVFFKFFLNTKNLFFP